MDNVQHDCEIGYTGPQFTYLASNLESTYQQPHVIDATLKDECEAGRILGPFDEPPLPNFRTSGLGLVPKHDGGWRIIYHLSALPAQSINDYIDPQLYPLSYCTIDDACTILGAYWDGRWLQCHWSFAQSEMDITWKELLAIVLVVHTWGSFGLAKVFSIAITKLW